MLKIASKKLVKGIQRKDAKTQRRGEGSITPGTVIAQSLLSNSGAKVRPVTWVTIDSPT